MLGSSWRRGEGGSAIRRRVRVRFAFVEGIDTTIKAVLRGARGMRDEQLLLLELRICDRQPIPTSTDLAHFVHQGVHANR